MMPLHHFFLLLADAQRGHGAGSLGKGTNS